MAGKAFTDNEYVVWLEFDENTNAFLNDKSKKLAEQEIAPGVLPPHMTLGFVRCDNEKRLEEEVRRFFENIKNISIKINSIGYFPGGVLYYQPIVTSDLLGIQKDLSDHMGRVGELSWDLYLPGSWTPHIAMSGGVSDEDSKKALTILGYGFEYMEGAAVSVKLRKLIEGKEVLDYRIR